MAITVKQEPQELDQMYLDDGELRETRCTYTVCKFPLDNHRNSEGHYVFLDESISL